MLEKALRDEGSEGFPFPSIVASGPRSALPHARSSEREVENGDFLLIDFGAVVGGYCADVTRTVRRRHGERGAARDLRRSCGTRTSERSRAVRAGMRGRDADALARDYIEAPRFRRRVRTQPRSRDRPRGARGAAAGADRGGVAAERRGGDDRAGHLSAGVGRRAHRGRRAPRARTGPRCSPAFRAS